MERSVTPNRGTETTIDSETIEDYLRFPDPKKHLIGFICGIFSAPKRLKLESSL